MTARWGLRVVGDVFVSIGGELCDLVGGELGVSALQFVEGFDGEGGDDEASVLAGAHDAVPVVGAVEDDGAGGDGDLAKFAVIEDQLGVGDEGFVVGASAGEVV